MILFQPGNIGGVELKNKLVMAPVSLNLNKDGFVTDDMVEFFEERSRGGAGLISLGDGIIDHPLGSNSLHSTAIDDDKYLPMLRELTRRVRQHGAKMCINLSHGGRRAGRVAKSGYLDVTKGNIPVAPSPVAHPVPGYVVPRELTVEEIEELINKFGAGARRAVEAGFEFIGLHCAHMYLCGEFLSPWANKRRDEYGGDLERRLRFPLRLIARIKQEVGNGYPLIVRMNAEEPEGGNTFEEIKQIAGRIGQAGADAIFISVGFGAVSKEYPIASVSPMRAADAYLTPLAAEIKKAVRVPVITVNKIRSAAIAEAILQAGKADFVAVGRPFIADPEFASKASAGRYADITPCIFCNRCVQSLSLGLRAFCTVNPRACREGQITVKPAATAKQVVVVGGGPAGLEAAIVAAGRGHRVAIFEKGRELGGQLLLAVKPPGKGNLGALIEYFSVQVKKLGIKVESDREITAEEVEALKPDVVIVATGGVPEVPGIPGIQGDNVVTAWQALAGSSVGEAVVVIGGGLVGAETAELLAEQGKSVTIVEMLGELAIGMPDNDRLPLLISLEKLGVRILTRTKALKIADGKLLVGHLGEEKELTADTIVLATGLKCNDEIARKLKDKVPELFVAGDCSDPGRILEAMRAGFEVACKI